MGAAGDAENGNNGGAIDLHAHVLPPDCYAPFEASLSDVVPRRLTGGQGETGLQFPDGRTTGPFPDGLFDADARLVDMDEQGVTHHVLSPPPFTFFYDAAVDACRALSQYQNDAMLDLADTRPSLFSALATLPMPHPAKAVEEVHRLSGRQSLRGVTIGSNVNGDDLSDPRFEPLWGVLAEADLGVFIHPVSVFAGGRMRSHFLRNLVGNPAETTLAAAHLIFGGVLERFPSLRVCLAHGGGFAPYQVGRWDHGWRVRAGVGSDLPREPSHYLSQLYFDTIVHDRVALDFLGRRIGWSRVVLGTDYPFDMGAEDSVAQIREAALSDAERQLVLADNGMRFLRAADTRGAAVTAGTL